MATQNIVARGGRASGGSSYTPATISRQTADNTVPGNPSVPLGQDSVASVGGVPATLNAAVMDKLFAESFNTFSAPPGSGETPTRVNNNPDVMTSRTRRGYQFGSNESPYAGLGWELGWNTTGSTAARGIAAFGPEFKGLWDPTTQEVNLRWADPAKVDTLLKLANVDPSEFVDATGQRNDSAMMTAVNAALQKYYRVSGDTNGISGYANPGHRKFASAIYRKEGDVLKAIPGTTTEFIAPENSHGFWRDSGLGAALGILAAPILGAAGLTGPTGAITSAIANSTGMSPFWANILGSSLVRGGMAAIGGGDFIRGAASGAIGAGVTPVISSAANDLAGAGTTGATLLNGAGQLGLSAVLNGGNLTPMAVVSQLVNSLGKPKQATKN